MRHAYLINAHNQPKLLKILLYLLDDKDNDIVLHLDKKSKLKYNDFCDVVKQGKLYFCDNRVNCQWGVFTDSCFIDST